MTTTKKRRRPQLLVYGHTLMNEGAPFDNAGNRLWIHGKIGGTSGVGFGFCSCGQGSRWEYTTAMERKEWHHTHKRAVMDPAAYDAWIDAVDKFDHP